MVHFSTIQSGKLQKYERKMNHSKPFGIRKFDHSVKFLSLSRDELTCMNTAFFGFIWMLSASILGLAMFTIPVGHNVRLVFGDISLFILMNILAVIGYGIEFHSIGVPYASEFSLNFRKMNFFPLFLSFFTVRCISINMLLLIVSIIISNLTYQTIINTYPSVHLFLVYWLTSSVIHGS